MRSQLTHHFMIGSFQWEAATTCGTVRLWWARWGSLRWLIWFQTEILLHSQFWRSIVLFRFVFIVAVIGMLQSYLARLFYKRTPNILDAIEKYRALPVWWWWWWRSNSRIKHNVTSGGETSPEQTNVVEQRRITSNCYGNWLLWYL